MIRGSKSLNYGVLWNRRSRYALRPRLIVPGNDRGTVGGRKYGQRRHHLRPGEIIMDVSEESLHARHQSAALEQFADRHCRIQRRPVATVIGLGTQVRIDVGGRRDAAGEYPGTSFQ